MGARPRSVSFVIWLVLGWVAAAAAASGEGGANGPEDLFELAGCRYVMEWVENGVWAAVLGGEGGGGPAPSGRMSDLLCEAFACERLIPAFRSQLEARLDPPVAEASKAFFRTTAGRRVARTWVDLAFTSSPMKIRRYFSEGDDLTPERLAVMERVTRAVQVPELRWAVMTEPALGLARGRARLEGRSPEAEEEHLRELWSMGVDSLWTDLEAAALASTAYQYRNIGPADLEAFLGFAESVSGEAFYAGFCEAVIATLGGVARFLEDELPRRFALAPGRGL